MNNINEEVGERLEIFIKHLDITVEEFCRITHLKRGTVDKARKGKHGPRVETLDGITKGYPQLNLRWLITGEGEMLQRQLSKEETTLLDHYWAHTDRTNFMVRVQFYWDEYAEKEYMEKKLKAKAPELDVEKKKLLKWHLWEFQERRRWLDVHRSYIERKIKEGALLFSTSEVNDAKKQVKEIEDRIIHWIKLESEEAKKIMEE